MNHVSCALDLGCGNGKNMGWTDSFDYVFGIDINRTGLIAASMGRPTTQFLEASGETLPFADNSIDEVQAWVSIPYMDIPATLEEIARVLKPGGYLFLSLHRWPRILQWWFRDIRTGNWKGAMFYQPYIVLNGVCLDLFGYQFRFPLRRRRIESFQTERGMRRVLHRCDFRRVEFRHAAHRFLVSAIFDPSR